MVKNLSNLEIISRDGTPTYALASFNAHPNAIQISDRFHLLKNLFEAVAKHMRGLFLSRLQIPATQSTISSQMQALYNTSNRTERIIFVCDSKR